MHHALAAPGPTTDEVGLADSTYEFIHTYGETESQDDTAPDFLDADLDLVGQSDEITSLASTDPFNDAEYDSEADYEEGAAYAEGHMDRYLAATPPSKPLRESDGRSDAHALGDDEPTYCLGQPLVPGVKHAQSRRFLDADLPRAGKRMCRTAADSSCTPSSQIWSLNIRQRIVATLVTIAVLVLPVMLCALIRPFGDFGRPAPRAALQEALRLPPSSITATSAAAVPPLVTVTVTSTQTVQPHILQDLSIMIAQSADNAARAVESEWLPAFFSLAAKLRDDAISATVYAGHASEAAQDYSIKAIDRFRGSYADRVASIRRKTGDEIARQLEAVWDFGDDLNFALLRAQIGSRMMWLKAKGDVAELRRYQGKAAEFLKASHDQLMDKRDRKPPGTTSSRFSWVKYVAGAMQ